MKWGAHERPFSYPQTPTAGHGTQSLPLVAGIASGAIRPAVGRVDPDASDHDVVPGPDRDSVVAEASRSANVRGE
jgi:hypothetical protein